MLAELILLVSHYIARLGRTKVIGDSSKAHGIKGYSLHPTEQFFLKTLDRTHLQGRKSDKAPKYDGYHLLFTFLFISGPLLEIKAVLLYRLYLSF